jgi:subtilisin family serine protease
MDGCKFNNAEGFTNMMTISNAKSWHDKGFKGKGIKVMVAEPRLGDYHAESVRELVETYVPEATILMYQYESYKEVDMIDFALKNKVDIINTSFGVGYPRGTFIEDRAVAAYKKALDHGVIIINSAGNEGLGRMKDNALVDERIINVGMCTKQMSVPIESSYDLKGSVDCCGLVGHILKDGTVLWGTSEAAPYVTGLLAIVLSKEKMTVREIMTFIAEHSIDLLDRGKDNASGYGLLVLPKHITHSTNPNTNTNTSPQY